MKRVVNPILSSEKGHFRDCPCNSEQIDSGTIDGNVEFVHSQYSCILTPQVSIQLCCVRQNYY